MNSESSQQPSGPSHRQRYKASEYASPARHPKNAGSGTKNPQRTCVDLSLKPNVKAVLMSRHFICCLFHHFSTVHRAMHENHSHPEPDIDDGGNPIVDKRPEDAKTSCTGQKLPNELIALIVGLLKGNLSTLASIAQVSHDLYDFAIPILYETVTINKKNVRQVGYGHSGGLGHGHTSPRRIRPEVLSRKDKATTFTRKLIFEDALDADLRAYSEVTDAILTEPCFAGEDDTRFIANTLRSLTARNHPPTPLHVSLHMGQVIELDTSQLLQEANSKSVCFEIFDMPRSDHIWWNAFRLRSVIHIAADGWVRSRRADHGPDRILLAEVLNRFMTTFAIDPHSGRLYICVTPELRFLAWQPQDFENGPLDAARTAVYDALYIVSRRDGRLVGWSNEQKAAYYDSMIEFVAPGFQPPFPSDITSGQDE